MRIKIKKNAYVYAEKSNLRDFLKANEGKWLEVETSYLFNNQYNTKNFRIFDTMVEEIQNEVRHLWCKNKYTGSMVIVGEEENYLQQCRAKIRTACEGCFWYEKTNIKRDKQEVQVDKNKSVETITTTWERKCSYKDGCTHEEPEKYGFEYFTPKNTYFLRVKNEAPFKALLETWQEVKIGTYIVYSLPSLGCMRIKNNRKNIDFKYIEGLFYVGSLGWRECKKLDVPDKVNKELTKIIEEQI